MLAAILTVMTETISNQKLTILITGATSGFGLEAAKLLANDGHKLILVGRRNDRLKEIAKSLKTDTFTAAVDVTDKAAVKAMFKKLPSKFQNIDVVVNSAGLARGVDPITEAKIEDMEEMIATNVTGLMYVTKYALDGMIKRGSGLIVNIGSVSAYIPYRGSNVYGATKAFVRQFSRNLRTDLFGTGIKVSNIEPGAAETEFSLVRFRDQQKSDDYYKGWTPLKPEDVAATIVWVINQPKHVNIDNVEIMSVDQTYGGTVLNKAS